MAAFGWPPKIFGSRTAYDSQIDIFSFLRDSASAPVCDDGSEQQVTYNYSSSEYVLCFYSTKLVILWLCRRISNRRPSRVLSVRHRDTGRASLQTILNMTIFNCDLRCDASDLLFAGNRVVAVEH